MFLVSDILNGFFNQRLKSKEFREQCYKKAIEKKLRTGRINNILLRNLNNAMSENSSYHDEFRQLLGGKDFQEAFWESDLGYLWYQGNFHNQNVYFNRAIEEINKHNHSSLLDVGCGWGEFPEKISNLKRIEKVTGIDISENIIAQARQLHQNSKVHFECISVLDVTEKYDLITLFGSTDYIPPDIIYSVLEKIIQLANKQILIVNSLRKVPLNEALQLKESLEIKRYDIGYVHPLKKHLDQLKLQYNFNFTIEKAGTDSLLVVIEL